ncbi:MAG: nucleoside deaminase [Cytophagales bacterium]
MISNPNWHMMGVIQPPQKMETYMQQALALAKRAYEAGEVPVGAVVVLDGVVVGEGYNRVEEQRDATAHAELLALQAACKGTGMKYLVNATLYTTLEPCPMCAMASFWTQIDTVVFGASDAKRGYRTISSQLLHPRTKVVQGIHKKACQKLLKEFFRALR